MASQSEQPQPEGGEDFKPKKIENRRPLRRSVPRLNNESVRMQQIKTLQAQLTSIIPDDNDGADSDGTDTNVGEDSQVDVSSVLRNHYYPRRTSALSVPASRRTSLSSIESISSAPTSSTPRTSSLSFTHQSVELGRSSSVADDKSDDNNDNTQSVNRRPRFRPSRLYTASRSTTSTIASSASSAKSSTVDPLPNENTSSDGDDYDDFLAFLTKGENHNNDNLNPQSSPTVDVSRESDVVSEKSSISNKLKSSFGLSFKSNKRQRQNMQLPTYEFLVKDNHDGASTLPKTSWWHGVFFFSFISLIACIITLWVSLYFHILCFLYI